MMVLLRALRHLARSVQHVWIWFILPYLIFAVSCYRSPFQTVHTYPVGPVALSPRVALFIHWDRHGEVRPYVLEYLRHLQAAGLSVVLVSNAGKLSEAAIANLAPFCAGILVRRNVGYDFAAIREGLAHFSLPRANTEMLVLANDSVYGPLTPLDDLLTQIDFDKADMWGATETWQRRYHVQSYFMVVGRTVLEHPSWAAFWGRVRGLAGKQAVITFYEIGFTQAMLRAGLRVASIWRYRDLAADMPPRSARIAKWHPLNPTSDLWKPLLEAGFPFLKRELLCRNPSGVDVSGWRDVVSRVCDADLTEIERDLQRSALNRVP